ncbi:glycine betaine ABC transporter substrate-binding protein [Sanguibacter suaedae]|uniref:Glycine/betaine ABC transporter substrate-binding protein n=1 Tax=Sanguibacter suaedae TaxID=2795737 RepID=A0A934M5R7_9MICO|nr:glycine betaine ABC transporter substrate-binding protein [Sanguibacter suaedae]MBI9113397.1 glycine/betaine ABC transporter substrate-binding protein [Sanguibacter suaedae]
MRTHRPQSLAVASAALGLALVLSSCGDPGSSGGPAPTTASAGGSDLETCEAVPGEGLVALEDDMNLQNPENVIPAVNAEAVAENPELLEVLDTVSAVLDTPALVALNAAVEVDRQTSAQAAEAFVAEQGLDSPADVGGGASVVVGSQNFTEGATLAAIYAEVLDSAGFDATVQDVGNRELYLADLESGAVTVVPEYVSTLTEFLNLRENGPDAETVATTDLTATMSGLTLLTDAAGIAVGTPSDAQNQNAFAVTAGFAEEHDVATLSDLAASCGGIVLGGPPECPERTFCGLGLEETYGIDVAEFTSLDAGGPLTKQALADGTITLGLVFSSDSALG